MHPLVNIAIKAARQAGHHIIRAQDIPARIRVSAKDTRDFVTNCDQESEEIIMEVVRRNYPHHAFLAEESGETGQHEVMWIIDPIDGTTNFLNGYPHFCVSIAVAIEGVIEHGVIYDPVTQDLFQASRGKGARLNDKRMRINRDFTIERALIGTGFPYKDLSLTHDYMISLQAIFAEACDIRRSGSAALDLANVAAGRLHGFWETGLKPWDVAAGALMVKEAGGMVSDFAGNDNWLAGENIVVGTPKVWERIRQLIQDSPLYAHYKA